MTGAWAAANAALLAARGLESLDAAAAQALLALLHAGTLVEADAATMRALDLDRLARWRALASGTPPAEEAERAAIGLLALGHREPARARLAAAPTAALARAWAAWVGEGNSGHGVALEVDGLRLRPAADRGELALDVHEPLPAQLAIRRLRVGGSVLDVVLRARPAGLALRLARLHGPSMVVSVALPDRFGAVTVDDVDGLAPPVRFELVERSEVVAYG